MKVKTMKNDALQCVHCGQYFDKILFKDPFNRGERAVWYNDKPYCPRCASLFGTCGMCKHRTHCTFQEDPTPIPKKIIVQYREGDMTVMKETYNPKRIKALCIEGECKCVNKINGKYACGRVFMTCPNYEEGE
jgi:hypothetical protein